MERSHVKLALGVTVFCAMSAAPALANGEGRAASATVLPIDCQFDLSAPARIERERATQVSPTIPRGTDTRPIAWNPPAVSMALATDGPVLSAGALGKTRKGVPGLAHVVIGWDF